MDIGFASAYYALQLQESLLSLGKTQFSDYCFQKREKAQGEINSAFFLWNFGRHERLFSKLASLVFQYYWQRRKHTGICAETIMKNYFERQYNDNERWMSYWRQIDEILKLKPTNVLEVGAGNGLAAWYLKSCGINLSTCDVDRNLKPDVIGSVENLPFNDNSFDVVLCAEVLEHLPFGKFQLCLSELRRVSKKHVVLSLPHWGWTFRFCLKIPLLPPIRILWKISGALKHKSGEHLWEIGKRGYSLGKIKKEINAAGFEILNDFILFENPYHHFFILEKL